MTTSTKGKPAPKAQPKPEPKPDVKVYPLNGGQRPEQGRRVFEQRASEWASFNVVREEKGTLGWDGILLAFVFAALSAETVDDMLDGLERVAAVAEEATASLKLQNAR